MYSEGFSRADVELLKTSPSEPVKIGLIEKLHKSLKFNELSGSEKIVAEEIIRFLAADISVRVRESIATRFCDSVVLPYDIAVKLANDLEDLVAVPIIQNSSILSDKDLITIIEQGNTSRQKAVASRPKLSDQLCTHIIDRTPSEVLTTLVNNRNSKLSAHNCDILIRHNSSNQPLMKAMIANKKITPTQAHDLLTLVSTDLQKLLVVEYNIPSNVVNNLVHDSKEAMIMNMILSNLETRNQTTLSQMIGRLHSEGDLTFSVLVKSLSFGNLAFFETGLAKLSNTDIDDLRSRLWSLDGEAEFKKIYMQCRLPESMGNAVYKLATITHEELNSDNADSARIYYRILNRLARVSNNEKILNLDYLVTIVAYNLKKSDLL